MILSDHILYAFRHGSEYSMLPVQQSLSIIFDVDKTLLTVDALITDESPEHLRKRIETLSVGLLIQSHRGQDKETKYAELTIKSSNLELIYGFDSRNSRSINSVRITQELSSIKFL